MSKKIKSIKIIDPGTNPDVDSDFHTEGRGKVIQHVIDLYGSSNVAGIITPGPFKSKNAFKSMATIYNLPFAQSNQISSTLPDAVDKKSSIKAYLDPDSESYEAGRDFRLQLNSDDLLNMANSAAAVEGRMRETGVHPCFDGDTFVNTNSGLKRIKNIKVGDLVLTHKNRYKEVVELMKRKTDNYYILRAANSTPIKSTGNHPFLVKNKLNNEILWLPLESVDPSIHLVASSVNLKNESINLKYNLPFEDEDFWWVVGRFVGDGWVEEFETKRNKVKSTGEKYTRIDKVKRVKISVGREDKTYNLLINKLSKYFSYRTDHDKTCDKLIINKYNNTYDLFYFLKEFGHKATGKHIPYFMYNLDTNYLESFLNGYLSADGSMNKTGLLGFNTVSEELMLGLIMLINKTYKKHCNTQFEKRNKMIIENRVVNCNNRFSASFFKEKRNKEKSYFDGEYIWSKITEIKLINKSKVVYNLSVIDDNSYTANNLIVHNCGMLISSQPISNTVPVQIRQSDGLPVTQWNYYNCEALGLIKMDFLGLDTVDLIDETVKNIKYTKGIDIDTNELFNGDLSDPKTYELFSNAETTAIFQFSSPGVKEMLRDLKPTEFMDLASVTALYRPGPMGMGLHEEFTQRKHDPSKRIPVHKSFIGTPLEEILAETYGGLTYQEQIMSIAKICAGFSSREADDLRKAIGKKKMSLMMSLGDKFKEGMIKNGYQKEAVNILWGGIVGFGEYCFNKSHSVSYALMAYVAAYLKANYPVEFMAAALKQHIDKPDKVIEYLGEVKRMNITIQPASVNESQVVITPSKLEENTIVYGLSGIKRFSAKTAEAIIKERNSNGQFKSLTDFLVRMNKHEVLSNSTIKALAVVGAFDCLGVSRKAVVDNAQRLIKAAEKRASQENTKNLFSMMGSQQETDLIKLSDEEFSYTAQAKYEADLTGLFLSRHPLDFIEQKEIHLDEPEVNVTGLYVTFSSVDFRTTKSKQRYLQIVADNKISRALLSCDREIVKRIEKHTAIEKFGPDEAPIKLGINMDNPIEVERYQKLKPMAMPSENITYKIDIVTPKYIRNEVEVTGRAQIIDIKPVMQSYFGKLVTPLLAKHKELEKEYVKLLKENKGNDTIRLIFPDRSYFDIENVKFMPGTTQNDMAKLDRRGS